MESYKRAGLGAFVACKCPRCGKGRVFKKSIVSVSQFSDIYEECPSCGLNYEPETGFFFGAMYWSYALIVGTIVAGGVVLRLLGWWEYAIGGIIGFLLLNIPVIIRYSRMLMLFVVYPMMYKEKFYGHSVEEE